MGVLLELQLLVEEEAAGQAALPTRTGPLSCPCLSLGQLHLQCLQELLQLALQAGAAPPCCLSLIECQWLSDAMKAAAECGIVWDSTTSQREREREMCRGKGGSTGLSSLPGLFLPSLPLPLTLSASSCQTRHHWQPPLVTSLHCPPTPSDRTTTTAMPPCPIVTHVILSSQSLNLFPHRQHPSPPPPLAPPPPRCPSPLSPPPPHTRDNQRWVQPQLLGGPTPCYCGAAPLLTVPLAP